MSILALASACRSKQPEIAQGDAAATMPLPGATASAAPVVKGPLVYVSNEDSNNISIIDSATDSLAGTIFVGKRPRGIRLSPDGHTLYVAVSGSPKDPPNARDAGRPLSPDRAADGIALVDVATRAVTRTIPSGQDPEAFDLTPDGKLMYVSNEETAQATVLELPSGRITQTIALEQEPEGVTMKPDGAVVYITSEAANKVFAIETKTNRVKATIETGPRPRSVVFTPDGARGYITEEQGSSITVVDAKKHKALSQIKLDGATHKPMGAVVAPDGKTVFISTGRGGSVVYIDTATNKVVKTVDRIGVRPWGIGVTADGRKLYTANGPSNDVSVIDVAEGRVIANIKVGSLPWGIVVAR